MVSHEQNLELALIGNCTIGALVNRKAEIVWCCMPRFDGDPVFCALLKNAISDSLGAFAVDIEDFSHSEQSYEKNTAVLKTVLYDTHGNGVIITDFIPRFKQFGRTYRPMTIIRKLVPILSPRLRIKVRPMAEYGEIPYEKIQGSNHIRFVADSKPSLRLSSTLSVTAIMDEQPYVLDGTHYLLFSSDESVQESLAHLGERFLQETEQYWFDWSRYLAIPFEWQEAVIRAAITLKLSAYEDTGAIIAAMTTSIPEAEHTQRNWDYRFCWLRDSFFTVHALNRLGATQTMEQYLQYLVNIVASMDDQPLQPVFRINGAKGMPEKMARHLPGYRGMGPVRIGNQAAEQVQHDVYGAVILSVTQMFFDERIRRRGDQGLFQLLEKVGEKALACFDQPDAGLWELRGSQHVHTFSSMMCWAAADRLAKIAKRLGLPARESHWKKAAERIREAIEANGVNAEINSYTATWGGDTMDASLLLACELGYIDGKDPRFTGTLAAVEKALKPEGRFLFRYVVEDDFGAPENAFTICSFWYIDALAAAGRHEEARELFEDLLHCRNQSGLLSEDINPKTGELWGNFPQTYSMVGIINSARILSKSWESSL